MSPRRRSKRTPKITNSLWKYRKRLGFTQQEVATLLGCRSDTVVIRYEKGERLPILTTALKLGIVYGVPVEFLFGDLYDQLRAEIGAKAKHLPVRRLRELSEFQAPESPREFRWPGLGAALENPF
jgi:transcriptional regulator with XRE-family HTH domain